MSDVAPAGIEMDDPRFHKFVIGIWSSRGVLARMALALAAAMGCVVFGIGSDWVGIPRIAGFDGSILLQPSPVAAVIVVGILLVLAAAVGTVLAGGVRTEAGLLAAAAGLGWLSLRSGTIQAVLFEAGGAASVFVRLIVELVILGAMLAGIWHLLGVVHRINPGPTTAAQPAGESGPPRGAQINAGILQVVWTGVVLLALCQTTAKNQCFWSVFTASAAGSILAFFCLPVCPGRWSCMAPLVVGIIGYAWAAMGKDTGLAIGTPMGTLAALARPLPLNFAGAGPVGAMVGYWIIRAPPADAAQAATPSP